MRRRPLTADELAGRSGVSKSTVFRYYAGKALRPILRDAIETVLREHSLQGAAPPRVGEVIVAVSPAHRAFHGYAEVIQGIIERMETLGGNVRILPGPVAPALPSTRGAWVVLGKPMAEEQADAAALERAGQPFVLVNRDYGLQAWNTVGVSMRRAAADAVTRLLDRGHRRVAVVYEGADQFQVAREKVAGYRQAFTDARLPVPQDLELVIGHDPFDEAMSALVASGCTAVFCIDDELAFSVLRWAAQRHVRIPEDLAVMGFNDLNPSRFFSPSLSSVRLPFRAVGAATVDALELLTDPQRRGLKLELRHEVVERESTARKHQEHS
jgi:DNA-binding LacI/PurR family transcriptional regulator